MAELAPRRGWFGDTTFAGSGGIETESVGVDASIYQP